jgi:hypothetical protein
MPSGADFRRRSLAIQGANRGRANGRGRQYGQVD